MRLHQFIHLDCYRIASARETAAMRFGEWLRDPENIILIEWADRIKKILPRDATMIYFTHGKKSNEMILHIKP